MDYHTLPLFSLQPETKEIPLSQGKTAIVDVNDYEWLTEWKWYAAKGRRTWYAQGRMPAGLGKKTLMMHRLILGLTESLPMVDHIDGNGLNNTRANLRVASNSENQQNRGSSRKNTSGYKGVYWNNREAKWETRISAHGRRIRLGSYDYIEDAAQAYDAAALFYFGPFAHTNFR